MAHPKLGTVINRSLIAASTAALIAGPLAAVSSAQVLDADPVLDLTCEEAEKTEDSDLIEEFCDEDDEGSGSDSPVSKTVDDTKKKTEKEVESTTETVETTTGVKTPSDPTGGGGDDGDTGGGGDDSTTGVLPSSPGDNDKPKSKSSSNKDSRQVRTQGEVPRGIQGNRNSNRPSMAAAYGTGGGHSGMQSNSALTLQPFAAPLVSTPPLYELPQVAQELLGLNEAAGDEVAMGPDSMTATAYSPTGYASSTEDPTGWLAATATGLIMLLGAAHALAGARTPKRQKA